MHHFNGFRTSLRWRGCAVYRNLVTKMWHTIFFHIPRYHFSFPIFEGSRDDFNLDFLSKPAREWRMNVL
jgi:hypothetical protein